MATHGVDLEYVGISGAGIQAQGLREPRPYAGSRREPEFIASLDSAGYKNLGAEDLVRLRDHGVSGDYIAEMKALGYAPRELRGAGGGARPRVDPSYIRSLKEAGYDSLSLGDSPGPRP